MTTTSLHAIPISESHRKALELLADGEGRAVGELLEEAIRAYVARPEKLALVAPVWSAEWSGSDGRSWWPSADPVVLGKPRDLPERSVVMRSGSLTNCLRSLKDGGVGHVMFPDGGETEFFVLSIEDAIQSYEADPAWVAASDATYGLDGENRTWIVSSSRPERNPEEPLWVPATRSTLAGVTHTHCGGDACSEPCPGYGEDRRIRARQLRKVEIHCVAFGYALFGKNIGAKAAVEQAKEHLGDRVHEGLALGPVDDDDMKEIAAWITKVMQCPRTRCAVRRALASKKVKGVADLFDAAMVAEELLHQRALRPDPSSKRDLDEGEPADEDDGLAEFLASLPSKKGGA